MDLINSNPYRKLGLLAGTKASEQSRQIKRLKQFIEAVNIKPNGKPYIQYKIKDVAQFICDNFVDENGQPISQATIQTYLSPNRTDKDPNSDMKVRF